MRVERDQSFLLKNRNKQIRSTYYGWYFYQERLPDISFSLSLLDHQLTIEAL